MHLNLEKVAAGIGIVASNVVAWAQATEVGNWGIGGIVTGITAMSAALCTAVVFGLRQIGPAYVDFRKNLDEAYRESLSGQLKAVNDQLEHARTSLHAIRNESAAERERHALEVERQLDVIKALHETIDRLVAEQGHAAEEITKLRAEAARNAAEASRHAAEVQRLSAEVQRLTEITQAVSAKLSGEFPASPPGGP